MLLRYNNNTNFAFFFFLAGEVCGILVPRPGIEPGPPEVEVRSPKHWTAREFPNFTILMCIVQWLLVYSQCCVNITISRIFSSPQKEAPYPLALTHHLHPTPIPWQTLNYFLAL